jgi:hypothetical protein
MEMIGMKKVCVILTVVVLTIVSVSAAPQFSGNFGLDYKLGFDGTLTPSGVDSDTGAAELKLTLSSDYWDLAFRALGANGTDVDATATLKVNAILATADIELPVAISALVGNQNFFSSSVYADPNGSEGDHYALYSQSISRGNVPFGLEVGYNGLATVKAGYDVVDKGKFLSATVNPLDGVSFAFNMVNNATFDKYAVGGVGITASAAADIANLAGLDFGLMLSGSGWFSMDDASANNYFVAINGAKDAVSAFVEYTNEMAKSSVNVGGGYTINDTTKVSAGLGISDLTGNATVGAWAKGAYTIAGISTFVKYGFSENGDGAGKHYVQTGLDFAF